MSFVLARRLKELREGKELSLRALSAAIKEKCGIQISRESLLNYEIDSDTHPKAQKREGMSVRKLRCFAEFYGVSTDYLLGLTDVPSANADVRAACSFTGLSENAVSLLNEYFFGGLKPKASKVIVTVAGEIAEGD